MDNHFNQGYMPSYSQAGPQQQSLASFGNLTNPSHQQDSPSHTTLPPLQSGYQFNPYGHPPSQTGTPTTPHTPSSSSMHTNSHSAFSHLTPPNNQPGSMLPPSSYSAPYNMTQSLPYPSATSTSLPPSSSAGLPSLRPMPPTGLPSLSSTGQIGGPQPSFMQNEEQPTHVVGSQGRRGILPSAPGRPNPPAQGSGAGAKSMIPQKDADGKYPCPHCNKTYLHAKHLKRHLLRHTGDRPYMCHLCKDTFSRSDILKRHFQKCSIRRGNPTGANHLAHQRRNTNNGNRLSMSQGDGPIGLAGLQEVTGGTYSPNVNGDMSNRTSRANSMISPNTMGHRNSIAGLGILGSNNGEQMASSGVMQSGLPAYASSSAGPNYAPQMNGSAFTGQQQQMPFLGQQNSRFDNNHTQSPHQQMPNGDGSASNIDWNRMFNQGGQDSFIGTQPAKASSPVVKVGNSERECNDISTSDDHLLGNLYTHPGVFGDEYNGNGQGVLRVLHEDCDTSLQAKVDGLLHYCFPQGTDKVEHETDAGLVKSLLTVDGLKHLAGQYRTFHQHWPILHTPTFMLDQANDAVVLAILCVGAIYSPEINAGQTRQVMDFLESTITHALSSSEIGVPELQALVIIKSAFVWHGDSVQRQRAREEIGDLADIVNGCGLFAPSPEGDHSYSWLHSRNHTGHLAGDAASWDWTRWLEQEKRNRIVWQLFLMDASLAIFFNSLPAVDASNIDLVLPADDAAWNAETSLACAGAIGLCGLQAQMHNRSGTKRMQQPEVRVTLSTLLDSQGSLIPNSTNVYSKFILIHAIILRIIECQKGLSNPSIDACMRQNSAADSLPPTQRLHSIAASASSSGNKAPVDGKSQVVLGAASQHERKVLGQALDKWKRSWDMDMSLQFPLSQTGPQRIGFCHDGAQLFYLGRSFLQCPNPRDFFAPADTRFIQVMGLLKRIRGFAIGRPASRGQELAPLGHADEQRNYSGLTLDLPLLFGPYDASASNTSVLESQPPTYPL